MTDYNPFPWNRWKIELPSKENSNFIFPNDHIIIKIISNFGQIFLKNDMKTYICP
jgi:hypothetical protein